MPQINLLINNYMNFLSAMQFLTTIPIPVINKQINEKRLSNAVVYFPLVGLLLGLILAGTNNLLSFLGFQESVTNIILVISLIILTGALHLDGLSDTFDALLSGKDKEEMLKIMRDPHIGVMGVISIISILLLKISFLSSINPQFKNTALVLTCLLSRWGLIMPMVLFPYARKEGKTKVFIQNISLNKFFASTIIALCGVIIIWQIKGILVLIITAICVYIINCFLNKKLGGITGDTLGAVNEITEILVLLCILILLKVNL